MIPIIQKEINENISLRGGHLAGDYKAAERLYSIFFEEWKRRKVKLLMRLVSSVTPLLKK